MVVRQRVEEGDRKGRRDDDDDDNGGGGGRRGKRLDRGSCCKRLVR